MSDLKTVVDKPSDPVLAAFIKRAKGLIVARHYQEAIRFCRVGLLNHRMSVDVRLLLVMALMAVGRYDEVLAELSIVLDLEPDHFLARVLEAEAVLRVGDVARARMLAATLSRRYPGNAKVAKLEAEIVAKSEATLDADALPRTGTVAYPSATKTNALDHVATRVATDADAPDWEDHASVILSVKDLLDADEEVETAEESRPVTEEQVIGTQEQVIGTQEIGVQAQEISAHEIGTQEIRSGSFSEVLPADALEEERGGDLDVEPDQLEADMLEDDDSNPFDELATSLHAVAPRQPPAQPSPSSSAPALQVRTDQLLSAPVVQSANWDFAQGTDDHAVASVHMPKVITEHQLPPVASEPTRRPIVSSLASGPNSEPFRLPSHAAAPVSSRKGHIGGRGDVQHPRQEQQVSSWLASLIAWLSVRAATRSFWIGGSIGVVIVAVIVGFTVRHLRLKGQLKRRYAQAAMVLQRGTQEDFYQTIQDLESVLSRRPTETASKMMNDLMRSAVAVEFGAQPALKSREAKHAQNNLSPDSSVACVASMYRELAGMQLQNMQQLLLTCQAKYPNDATLLYLQAQLMARKGDDAEAEKILGQLVQRQPNHLFLCVRWVTCSLDRANMLKQWHDLMRHCEFAQITSIQN